MVQFSQLYFKFNFFALQQFNISFQLLNDRVILFLALNFIVASELNRIIFLILNLFVFLDFLCYVLNLVASILKLIPLLLVRNLNLNHTLQNYVKQVTG